MPLLSKSFLAGLLFMSALTSVSQTQTSAANAAQPGGNDVEGNVVPASVRILPEAPSAVQPDPGFLIPGSDPQNKLLLPFVKHMVSDQKQFWTSPTELTGESARTFVPFVAFTGLLMGSDRWISRQVPDQPNQLNRSLNVSNYAVYSLLGAGGGAFLLGQLRNNDHLSEAGLLSGEAALNSTAITYLLKGVTQRPRPDADKGNGIFFHGGTSFPSEHSALAWSVASVLAHEYPGPLTKFLAYSLASTVTLTRVTSKQHLASDAFIGSVLGWYLGRQIYRAHHDPELGGAPWGNFIERAQEASHNPENMGSPYVPLESWVYPVFDRLAALGYTQTAFVGLRPWTRMECARLVEETAERLRYGGEPGGEAQKLYAALVAEFSDETQRLDGAANLGASLDSIYTRVTGIAGPPLRDGYHFGQTIINDYGRPYGEGFNMATGMTAHAVAGPLAFYVSGEYQQAPATPAYSSQTLQAIATADNTPILSNAADAVRKFRLLDTYVAYNFRNTQISFGKQSLWLGPGDGGPLLFSDNAEPIWMLRINRVSPTKLPGPFRLMGPVRGEFFLGQLSGHHFVFSQPKLYGPDISPQPFIHGQKISFRPTSDLELGFAFSVVFGGPGAPFTFHNFLRTFTFSTAAPGSAADSGDRRGSFDVSYRLPFLRKWVTVYNDSLVDDEVSPIVTTHRAMHPGVYLPRIPKIPKLDLRLEGMYTDVPGFQPTGFFYANSRYRSGYTNNGNLLASWIGREGRGGQGWATYWLSPKNKIQLGYRNATVDKEFLRGGRIQDISLRTELMLHPDLGISGFLQYETWRFPLLASGPQANFTGWVQLTFRPRWKK
ncbi:MAG: phosphatase PAP2 family protein [Acidobacteriia bacterium]|nr:phosphatase PAP2 family protein [Terriglobia bacterium]